MTRTFTIDDIYKRLNELEALVRDHSNPDGSSDFDVFRVVISLDLAKRIIIGDDDVAN